MGNVRTRVRTDATSTIVRSYAPYALDSAWVWSSAVDVREFSKVALFFTSANVSVTEVEIVMAWSDDATTIPFSEGEYNQQSDYNIGAQMDGSFHPKTRLAFLSTGAGTLAATTNLHLLAPVKGGSCRFGVRANSSNGNFELRVQRLVV